MLVEIRGMFRRSTFLIAIATTLSSCSYGYDLLAVAQGGRLAFVVKPSSDHRPSCVREIEVTAEGDVKAQPDHGNASRLGYGTFWFESVGYDDACANRFPLPYGSPLKGQHQQKFGSVTAKPLRSDVIYNVSSTTGATGYGQGRFVIHANGHIENLPPPVGGTASNLVENSG
jgi:hypothetical protein